MRGEIPPNSTPSRTRLVSARFAGLASVLVAIALVGVWWRNMPQPKSATERMTQARAAFRAGRMADAESAVRAVLALEPEDSSAWMLLAIVAERQRQFPAAIEAYEHVTDSKQFVKARLAAGHLGLREPGLLAAAERQFQAVLAFDGTHMDASNGLAKVLAVSGRSRELAATLIAMIRGRSFSNFHLNLLSNGGESTVDPQLIGDTDDARTHAARGCLLLKQGHPTTALAELRLAVKAEPNWDWAHLALGRALLDSESPTTVLIEWHRALPPTIETHPEYWQLAAAWSRRQGQLPAAARCDWETVRRDPCNLAACFQLGRWLRETGDETHAVSFLTRAEELQRYRTSVESARNGDDLDALRQTVELAERLGLNWEAFGWSDLAAQRDPSANWPRSYRDRFAPQLTELPLERTVRERNPAHQIDLTALPLPQFNVDSTDGLHPAFAVDDKNQRQASIRFHDDAASVGLAFLYVNGGDPLHGGLQRMFEFTGGGVVVLDFDRDEWPDVFFVQGCRWNERGSQTDDLDRLFRNEGHGRFTDVTPHVGIVEGQFGQGATTGDVDQDGFPDIFVANIGGNRLFRNHGDGTFTEDTAFRESSGSAWSTSAAIADLNADGIPDIYVTNYLGGEDVFTRVCENQRRDRKQTCRPTHFPAADDQLLLGRGDGRFIDVTATAGILQSEGRGLGMIAARFEGQSRLGLFIANDGTANFQFVPIESAPTTDSPTPRPLFEDQARLAGTAFDGQGRAQACMGVASGDINGDTLLDLFVTNFEDETNTLYIQQPGGIFQDRTREFGLAAPSLKMLGFGTQCLDADLDGWPDLIVSNGHVNDTGDAGSAYQMPPQLFHNRSGRRFDELAASQLGPYFSRKYLGRAVATWDWNRDGLTDMLVTHLDAPAALLTNTTPTEARWLSVRLVGTASDRDAIGTQIDIQHAGRTLRRQLTAGDGYMASNERRLTFGWGETTLNHLTLQVTWPSGQVESISEVPLNHHIVVIEGTGKAIPLTPPRANKVQ